MDIWRTRQLTAPEEDDAVGGPVVDGDGADQDGHGIEGGLEGFGLGVGIRLSHGDPFVGRGTGDAAVSE